MLIHTSGRFLSQFWWNFQPTSKKGIHFNIFYLKEFLRKSYPTSKHPRKSNEDAILSNKQLSFQNDVLAWVVNKKNPKHNAVSTSIKRMIAIDLLPFFLALVRPCQDQKHRDTNALRLLWPLSSKHFIQSLHSWKKNVLLMLIVLELKTPFHFAYGLAQSHCQTLQGVVL